METTSSVLTPQKTILLEAKNLKKSFGKKEVITDISFNVLEGQIIGLLGPNGSGKTTTFYMLVGLEKPDKGSIEFLGKDISHLPMYKRALLGLSYLPQESSIFRKLTVEENILTILELWVENKVERQERLEELIEFLKVSHIRKSLGFSLSGGEKRRVEIARALASNPKLLLLDEPFAGIDPVTIIEIQDIIYNLVKKWGVSCIITDHNVRETLRVTDYAYIVVNGTIFKEGSPNDLANSEDVKRIYLGDSFEL